MPLHPFEIKKKEGIKNLESGMRERPGIRSEREEWERRKEGKEKEGEEEKRRTSGGAGELRLRRRTKGKTVMMSDDD